MIDELETGDLVKHSEEIKWRDQKARGVVTKIINKDEPRQPQLVKVHWLNSEERHGGRTNYHGPSLKVLAKSKDGK